MGWKLWVNPRLLPCIMVCKRAESRSGGLIGPAAAGREDLHSGELGKLAAVEG